MASIINNYIVSTNLLFQQIYTNIHILSFGLFLCCLYLLYYVTRIVHKPELHCSNKKGFKDKLIVHIKELQKDVWPLFWCYRPLMQTVLHSVFGHTDHATFQRSTIVTKDGGTFTLDWYGFQNDKNQNKKDEEMPIIVQMPGATGHSEKNYIRQFTMINSEMKYRTVVFNNRGLGNNVKLTTPVMSCVTKISDTEKILETVGERYPKAPIIVVAFSIGACMFTNYLARKGKNIHCNVRAAYIVSVPWNAFESKTLLSKFWNNLFINKHMVRELLKIISNNYEMFADQKHLPINLDSIMKCKTVWDFNDRYTSPMFGYKDHADLYTDASLHRLPLHNICIPVLNLNADDDPLCRRQAIPFEKIKSNPNMAVITTKYGGHMSWLEGLFLTRKRLHHRIFQQFAEMIFNEKRIHNHEE